MIRAAKRGIYETCRAIAPLTLEINRLKKEKDAVILAHSYVEPEIIYGVADFRGDSYFLSVKAKEAQAKVIVFAGVVFMAETAKILSPAGARCVVPDRDSGCSLADSLTGEQLRQLKSLYPDATVVCYINSTADVKAESDVCVTSGNVYHIVANLPAKRILFVPDRLMGQNVREELKRRGRRQGDHHVGRHLHGARSVWPGGDRRGAAALSRLEGGRASGVHAGGRGGLGLRRQHGRDDEVREDDGRAVLPDADRVRPRRAAAGRVAGEGVHRRLPAVSVHEAEFAGESPRCAAWRRARSRSSRSTKTCAAAPRAASNGCSSWRRPTDVSAEVLRA